MIDANLIIGAYWNRRSSSRRIIDGCLDSDWRHFYTPRIKREVFRILDNIHAKKDYREKIESLYRAGEETEGVAKVKIIKDDPDDDKYLGCAVECRANYIISNDKHLLRIKSFHGTEIIRPSDFVKDWK